MLAYRLPRGMSIIAPRSHCPQCKTTLGVLDLIPVFSWLAFKGRCRHCGVKISSRYIMIELAVSLSFAVVTVLVGFSAWLAVPYALIVAATTAYSIKAQKE